MCSVKSLKLTDVMWSPWPKPEPRSSQAHMYKHARTPQIGYCPLLSWHSPFTIPHSDNTHKHTHTKCCQSAHSHFLSVICLPVGVAAPKTPHTHTNTCTDIPLLQHTTEHTYMQMVRVCLYLIKLLFPVEIGHLVQKHTQKRTQNSCWNQLVLYEFLLF